MELKMEAGEEQEAEDTHTHTHTHTHTLDSSHTSSPALTHLADISTQWVNDRMRRRPQRRAVSGL